jgi:DNA polymerase/3'-5' exonuclease PolX
MAIHNNDIADIFNRVADLLEIRRDNSFRDCVDRQVDAVF